MIQYDPKTYRITQSGSFGNISLGIGLLFLILSAIGSSIDAKQFYHSYLISFTFWATLGLGGLFFVMLHYLTGAVWSTIFRRIGETVMKVLPWLFIFFIPIMLGGIHEIYHWSHTDVVADDRILQAKSGYLNEIFFIIRSFGYFLIWFFLVFRLYNLSVTQDGSNSGEIRTQAVRTSAIGMILFALTISFASFDWLMSTDPHWYSTIFGVYVFTGSYLAIITFLILSSHFLQKKGILTDTITKEHYHDLAKLMFTFVVFWAYIAGSQYFFIWYANIPEETIWYLHRWTGSWKEMSLFLIFGHFFIPFILLIFRFTKRHLLALKLLAGWVFFMHYIDLYWIVMPTLHHHGVQFSWMDLTTFIGIGGVFVSLFWRQLHSQPILPVNDPTLEESISFTNH